MSNAPVLDNAWSVAVYFGLLAGFVPLVWLTAEGLGAAVAWKKQKIAATLGIVLGVLAVSIGILPKLPTIFAETYPVLDWIVAFAWAAFSGLLATFGAEKLNDLVAKPLGLQLQTKTKKKESNV